jgi:antitoxin ParD1/3/4
MSEFEKLSVLIPSDLARRIRDAVDGEHYIVESDVILEALQDWEVKQQIRATKVARLRELIQEGEDSGFEPMSDDEFERIKQEGRALLASRNAAE